MHLTALMPALLLVTAACGKSDEPETTVTIEKANALRFQVVDDDSEYMRRVAAHVGEDGTGHAADPIARAAGVAAKEDVWRSEATPERVGHDWFLESFDRGMVSGRTQLADYFARLAEDPRFVIPQGHQIAYEQAAPGKWRSYYLHGPVVLDGSAVAAADASVDPEDRPVVMVDLTAEAARAFGDLTLRMTGKKLAVLVHDEVLSAPIIHGQIAGGRVSISMEQQGEAVQLAKALAR